MLDYAENHAQALKLFQDGAVAESATKLEQLRTELVAANDQEHAAEVGNDLGVAYYRLDRIDEARAAFEQARALFEKQANLSGQGRTLGNLAQALRRAGDKVGAEKEYLRAAELFHAAGEKEYEFDTYRALSQLQMQRGRWLESLATYELALKVKGGSRLFRMFLSIPLRIMHVR